MQWLVIKTDRDMQISTQKVIANELNEALNKAEEESNWKDTLCDDCILEGLDIYHNDIQAIQVDNLLKLYPGIEWYQKEEKS